MKKAGSGAPKSAYRSRAASARLCVFFFSVSPLALHVPLQCSLFDASRFFCCPTNRKVRRKSWSSSISTSPSSRCAPFSALSHAQILIAHPPLTGRSQGVRNAKRLDHQVATGRQAARVGERVDLNPIRLRNGNLSVFKRDGGGSIKARGSRWV